MFEPSEPSEPNDPNERNDPKDPDKPNDLKPWEKIQTDCAGPGTIRVKSAKTKQILNRRISNPCEKIQVDCTGP